MTSYAIISKISQMNMTHSILATNICQETENVMSKKIMSTILLFAVFIGFLWWGISMITSTLSSPNIDGESVIYGLLLLGCAGYALFSLLLLPRKKQP